MTLRRLRGSLPAILACLSLLASAGPVLGSTNQVTFEMEGLVLDGFAGEVTLVSKRDRLTPVARASFAIRDGIVTTSDGQGLHGTWISLVVCPMGRRCGEVLTIPGTLTRHPEGATVRATDPELGYMALTWRQDPGASALGAFHCSVRAPRTYRFTEEIHGVGPDVAGRAAAQARFGGRVGPWIARWSACGVMMRDAKVSISTSHSGVVS